MDAEGFFSWKFRLNARCKRCCGSGSGAFLTPGSGIRKIVFFPDPGSQTHIFEGLETIFWAKRTIIFCEFFYTCSNFLFFYFVIFVATNKIGQLIFSPSSFVAVVGSGIRDTGSGMLKKLWHLWGYYTDEESNFCINWGRIRIRIGIKIKNVGSR